MTRRIIKVEKDIDWNPLTIATITAERNINHTPGKDITERTRPVTAKIPAKI